MKVKICGITHPDDAVHAAGAGADFIGIIFASRSKRKVTLSEAKEIARAAKSHRSVPVGVFVEESVEQILSTCKECDLTTIQLHRILTAQELDLLKGLSVIQAISVREDGSVAEQPLLLPSFTPLFDCGKGGTGKTFNWKAFSPPQDRDWILAGGLNPHNVREAIALLKPCCVDVASGVEKPNSTRKDVRLVEDFIIKAKKEDL
jgi:phosphoribosylanthranilate isomerase